VIGRREFVLGAAAAGVLMQPRFGYANASHSPCLIWPRVIECDAHCSAKSCGRESIKPVPYESAVGEELAER
jgi:hypothetical protein